MVYGRPSILSPELEAELKDDLEWAITMNNATADQVTKYFQFGVKGTKYSMLSKHHFYYYIKKFGLQKLVPKPIKLNLRPWETPEEELNE